MREPQQHRKPRIVMYATKKRQPEAYGEGSFTGAGREFGARPADLLRSFGRVALFGLLLIAWPAVFHGQQTSLDPRQMVQVMVQHELAAAEHRGRYLYLVQERSERTGGHLWSERQAETQWGTLRYLTAEDGKPLSSERTAEEKARLAQAAADPESFQKEQMKDDEGQRARQMLALLPEAFLFDSPRREGQAISISFRPDPAYTPSTMEERVLHAMSGNLTIDAESMRLLQIQGQLPEDVRLGLGPLATVRAGSSFSTLREHLVGDDWRTARVQTDIKARVLFLTALARQQDSRYDEFRKLPDDVSLREASALLER